VCPRAYTLSPSLGEHDTQVPRLASLRDQSIATLASGLIHHVFTEYDFTDALRRRQVGDVVEVTCAMGGQLVPR
jgi:hypothetical protein